MGPWSQCWFCMEVQDDRRSVENIPGQTKVQWPEAQDAKNKTESNEIKSRGVETQKSQPEKALYVGQGLKTYPKEWSRALLLPRKPLYCQYASFPMWAEGHFCMHQAIWEINSLVSFHNLSSSSYPAVKPSLPPDPRTPTCAEPPQQLPPSSFSYPTASSWAELALPHILGCFSDDSEAFSVATASKQQAFPANLIPGLNVTYPTECFLDQPSRCVTGV